MIQLNILSGNKAGTSCGARRFPVRIGRASNADLRFEETGIWDQHLQLDLVAGEGFVVTAQANALVTISGLPTQRAVLRNGDILELGAVRIQFWLARTRQAGLTVREWLTWACIAAICLAQVGLVYWLLQS
jgi:hypothetical protein